jgi:hypothetical protein
LKKKGKNFPSLTIHLIERNGGRLVEKRGKKRTKEKVCMSLLFFTCRHPMEVLCPRHFIANIRSFPLSQQQEKKDDNDD